MRAIIALLALVSSALATYEIDSPNASEGWEGTRKQQTVMWRKASDDPSIITIRLVHPALAINKDLGIEGNTGEHKFDHLNGGWVEGRGYSIRIVDSVDSAVFLTQSQEFTIGGKNDA